MVYHHMAAEEVVKALESDASAGLSEAQAARRRTEYGENRLRERKKKTSLRRFLEQFQDPMILILLAAASISFGIACAKQEPEEFFEPALILLIVVLNAAMGMIQENRAEKALDALKTMSAPHARVIREGAEKVIRAAMLAPGDIIRLEAGDFVPADARLLRSASLKCEESALTGESVPAEKDADASIAKQAPLGDRTNMVFSGCAVTCGTGDAIVTATGMDTEMGKIAGMLEDEGDGQTPLQQKLARLGRHLGVLALAACVLIFAAGLAGGIPLMEIFMTSVSLAVSAIPEGLPAIVTIVLSIGVQRMVKKKALIRRLPAVETLGSASVICSDKTGTLTQNRMTLVKAWADGEKEPEEISTHNSEAVKQLLCFAALCCNGTVVFHGAEEEHIGDPTETAIVLAAYQNGMTKELLNSQYPRLAEIPFDSDRKLMTVISRTDGGYMAIVKGAFDMLAPRCISGDLEAGAKAAEEMSAAALRVLAVGYKAIDQVPEHPSPEEIENGLTFMGLAGMIDPPRPEAREGVALCRRAGIRPVMITGDHVATASAIGRELGILKEGEEAVTGMELDDMTDQELDSRVSRISIYARVSPANKIRIVKAWQKKGHVVAMTGDGVNDAPALKAADIGCAMGITGTDVAKGAADMVLTDDNFSSIVDAVREGRGIYANIKKVTGFLLGTNIGEVIAVFAAMLLWRKIPLLSMQLLWINLVTDSLPAIALGMEAVEADVMEQPPRPKEESLFAHGFGLRIILQGLLFGLLALTAFWLGERGTGQTEGGQTMAFMVLALSQVLQAFNMRSAHSLFQTGFFTNRQLNRAAAVSSLLMALVLFTPVRILFGLILLPGRLYLAGLALILVPLAVTELAKAGGL